jgi:PAP2 superfamily
MKNTLRFLVGGLATTRRVVLRASVAALVVGAFAGSGCGSEDEEAATTGSGNNEATGAADASSSAKAPQVFRWNTFTSNLVSPSLPPAIQAYVLSATHIAIHDALNAVSHKYEPYAFNGSASNASKTAAIAAAAHDTLVALVPQAAEAIEAEYTSALSTVSAGSSKTNGISVGQQAAAAILADRAGDDLFALIQAPYTPGPADPGVYQPTPPLNFVILAGWGSLRPFGINSGDQFRSAAPNAVTSSSYTADYNEVKAKGIATGSTRTAKESETAQFWYDAATKEWNLAAQKGLTDVCADEHRAARVLALMNIALNDAIITSFETKFAFNFWRPITAIRAGETDGNPNTAGDPTWEPFCVTPPFPEYNSTHAATGAAAAEALKLELGDSHGFKVDSPTLQGLSRNYKKFSDAANEEAVSRIFCGIHFRQAMDEGLAQGRRVAGHVHNNFLLKR